MKSHGTVATHAGQTMGGFSYKVSQWSRWKVPTCKHETASPLKISIQLISVGLWFIPVSNAKFPNQQHKMDSSDTYTPAKYGICSRLTTQVLMKLVGEEQLCKFMWY